MSRFRISLLLLVTGMLVTIAGSLIGCGKKGPLYVPDTVQQEQSDDSRDGGGRVAPGAATDEEQSKNKPKKEY